MNLITKLIRIFFLVKEIISKEGKVHFRRYRLLATPWLNIYIHQILNSDLEAHRHDHPWHFQSYIIKGSYAEKWTEYPDYSYIFESVYSSKSAMAGLAPRRVIRHHAQDAHKITILTPDVWTFVVTWGRKRVWGFKTEQGWIDFKSYRKLKDEGKIR